MFYNSVTYLEYCTLCLGTENVLKQKFSGVELVTGSFKKSFTGNVQMLSHLILLILCET